MTNKITGITGITGIAGGRQWLSIDSAPKDGMEIILYSRGDIGIGYWRDDAYMKGWTLGIGQKVKASHWMPLPSPPLKQEC